MRIGRKDFDKGHKGNVYQAIWRMIGEDEAVDEAELRTAYDSVVDPDKPAFDDALRELRAELETKDIEGGTYYVHRKTWLSTSEAARRLGVSKRTVQAWAQQGKLIGQRVGHGITSHRRIRFATDTVDEWLRGNRQATVESPGAAGPVVMDVATAGVWDNAQDGVYDRM